MIDRCKYPAQIGSPTYQVEEPFLLFVGLTLVEKELDLQFVMVEVVLVLNGIGFLGAVYVAEYANVIKVAVCLHNPVSVTSLNIHNTYRIVFILHPIMPLPKVVP